MKFETLEAKEMLAADAFADLVVLRGSELQILEGGDETFLQASTVDLGGTPHHLSLADMTGDGNPDVVAQVNGEWLIVDPTSNEGPRRIGEWIDIDWQDIHIDDFTGDGRNDIVGHTPDFQWWMLKNEGLDEGTSVYLGRWNQAVQWKDMVFADFNNDDRTDIVARGNGIWWMAEGQSEGISAQRLYGRWSDIEWADVAVGQFSGDALPDLIGRAPDGGWWVQQTNVDSSTTKRIQSWSTDVTWMDTQVADLDGDGLDDILSRTPRGEWWSLDVNADNAINGFWTRWNRGLSWNDVVVDDFNDDGAVDLFGFSSQGWHLSINGGATVGAWFDSNDPQVDMALGGRLDTDTGDIGASSVFATLRPSSHPIEISLDENFNFVMSGNGQQVLALNFVSDAGNLTSSGTSDPFAFYLAETANNVAIGSLAGQTLLGSITVGAGWDPSATIDDLMATYGVAGSAEELVPLLVGSRILGVTTDL